MPFLGWLSDPFKGLSDLQLGDGKGTLNHLDVLYLYGPEELQFHWLVVGSPTPFEKYARQIGS